MHNSIQVRSNVIRKDVLLPSLIRLGSNSPYGEGRLHFPSKSGALPTSCASPRSTLPCFVTPSPAPLRLAAPEPHHHVPPARPVLTHPVPFRAGSFVPPRSTQLNCTWDTLLNKQITPFMTAPSHSPFVCPREFFVCLREEMCKILEEILESPF
jgi:hypothetical protein